MLKSYWLVCKQHNVSIACGPLCSFAELNSISVSGYLAVSRCQMLDTEQTKTAKFIHDGKEKKLINFKGKMRTNISKDLSDEKFASHFK